MKIVSIKLLEDCFDGSGIYGYHFDKLWTRDKIMNLRTLGEVDYFPEFPRPFFRLRSRDGLQIKGVQGEHYCRAIFPAKGREVTKEKFERMFRTKKEFKIIDSR